jgi:hypothetical protein
MNYDDDDIHYSKNNDIVIESYNTSKMSDLDNDFNSPDYNNYKRINSKYNTSKDKEGNNKEGDNKEGNNKEGDNKEDENWSGANLETLSQWIQISSFFIESLELAKIYYRSLVRRSVILGLVFSTASGSLSLFRMNSVNNKIIYDIVFTCMSFSIAIFTGIIKVYQIQERLEEFITLKQEWISFSLAITTEIQLPIQERKLALFLITKHKNKYLDLLKRDIDIPYFIKTAAYKNLYYDKELYLINLKKFKNLKEIDSCTDDEYFLKEAIRLENNDSIISIKNEIKKENNKYIETKTSLSNILLNVIMEEENEQRSHKIIELLNHIRERKTFLEKKMQEYNMIFSCKNHSTNFESGIL